MSREAADSVEDFSDLGFDIGRHREALGSFAKMDLDEAAVRPALRARELVFVQLPSCRFAFGTTDDPKTAEEEHLRQGGLALQAVHQAGSAEEAGEVRREVERYFLRHYPGRTLAGEGTPPGRHVYVACFAPDG